MYTMNLLKLLEIQNTGYAEGQPTCADDCDCCYYYTALGDREWERYPLTDLREMIEDSTGDGSGALIFKVADMMYMYTHDRLWSCMTGDPDAPDNENSPVTRMLERLLAGETVESSHDWNGEPDFVAAVDDEELGLDEEFVCEDTSDSEEGEDEDDSDSSEEDDDEYEEDESEEDDDDNTPN